MKNAIFIVFDDNFIEYGLKCIKSIIQSYPEHPEILVVYDGHKEDVKTFLASNARIIRTLPNFNLIPFSLLNLTIKNLHRGIKLYYRFILWTDEFKEYDNILYLDADTITLKPLDNIMKRNGSFFCTSDFTPNKLSIFKPQYNNDVKLREMLDEDFLSSLPEDFKMMNSGVFVIPKNLRNEVEFNRLIDLSVRYSMYFNFADQSCISLWCYIKNISFSTEIEFNFQSSFFQNEEVMKLFNFTDLISHLHIYHFTWWKPYSTQYRSYKKAAEVFLNIDNYIKKLNG